MEIVLITGASSGIGKDLAYEFSKKGYNLLLVSRREELLKELKEELVNEYDIYVDYYACDLVKGSKFKWRLSAWFFDWESLSKSPEKCLYE